MTEYNILGKKGGFRKCRRSVRGIQRKNECGSEETRENRYCRRTRL